MWSVVVVVVMVEAFVNQNHRGALRSRSGNVTANQKIELVLIHTTTEMYGILHSSFKHDNKGKIN